VGHKKGIENKGRILEIPVSHTPASSGQRSSKINQLEQCDHFFPGKLTVQSNKSDNHPQILSVEKPNFLLG
jgi:hypothetical protein